MFIPCLHDQAIIKQTSSKYEACIKHSLHEANIKQTSSKHRANVERTWSWLVQLTYSSSSSQLDRVNAVLVSECYKRYEIGRYIIQTITPRSPMAGMV